MPNRRADVSDTCTTPRIDFSLRKLQMTFALDLPASSRKRAASHQRGFGVMSMLLALVIMALVVAGIYNQFGASGRNARIDQAKTEIVTMIAGAQKLYGNANQYGAVTTAIAIQGGVVPVRLRINGTNTAQNLYNGAIEFVPATLTSVNDSMVLTYGGVRKEDCQDLILGSDTLTRRISVGATVVKAADVAIDIAALSTACDASDTSDLNFTFGRGQ